MLVQQAYKRLYPYSHNYGHNMSVSPEDYNLTPLEISGLKALADACDYRLGKHVAEGVIRKKFDRNLVRDCSKAIRKLHSKGLAIKHPAGNNTTYELSRRGLELALTMWPI
jgi:hypothetical protein